jgi:hypothetical protein
MRAFTKKHWKSAQKTAKSSASYSVDVKEIGMDRRVLITLSKLIFHKNPL